MINLVTSWNPYLLSVYKGGEIIIPSSFHYLSTRQPTREDECQIYSTIFGVLNPDLRLPELAEENNESGSAWFSGKKHAFQKHASLMFPAQFLLNKSIYGCSNQHCALSEKESLHAVGLLSLFSIAGLPHFQRSHMCMSPWKVNNWHGQSSMCRSVSWGKHMDFDIYLGLSWEDHGRSIGTS